MRHNACAASTLIFKSHRACSNACRFPHPRRGSTLQQSPATAKLSSRWLSDVKLRLGKCLTFGLDDEQKIIAGDVLSTLSRDWRELVAGSEGFLTQKHRRGLYRYPIAWAEQDPFAHINNIVYNRWAETGRIVWTRNFGNYIDRKRSAYWNQLMVPKDEGLILRKITTEFKFPMTFPDRVSVYHKLSSEPDSSDAVLLDSVILSESKQRIAARTYEDIALYNYDEGRKVNKQSWMLDILRDTWTLQEETKKVNSDRVQVLLDKVRQLELDSWDRPDAVEDMGSASTP
ncbi:hypothetical protein AMS68_006588 [Peltaster fructicola]|uniref:Thioesterase domain-containing protein n=1 Tax=Peltaster fructicola TaxID=286661 RepID=A0A6H0Y2D0_9PEZI|nr:hypothetical protein AMS68_006588 [Peltaster fructicola]